MLTNSARDSAGQPRPVKIQDRTENAELHEPKTPSHCSVNSTNDLDPSVCEVDLCRRAFQ
jgi:hypothetical protein